MNIQILNMALNNIKYSIVQKNLKYCAEKSWNILQKHMKYCADKSEILWRKI